MIYKDIKAAQLVARKAKDSIATAVLTTLLGELDLKKNPDKKVIDTTSIAVCKKFIENAKENILHYKSEHAKSVARTEIRILEAFIPNQMSDEEVETVLVKLAPAHLGEAMKHLKDNYAGLYDGRMASSVARDVISSTAIG